MATLTVTTYVPAEVEIEIDVLDADYRGAFMAANFARQPAYSKAARASAVRLVRFDVSDLAGLFVNIPSQRVLERAKANYASSSWSAPIIEVTPANTMMHLLGNGHYKLQAARELALSTIDCVLIEA